MPKVLFSLLVASLLLAGCDTHPDGPSVDAARRVLRLQGQPQRLAFGLLSPEERALAWKLRFDEMKPALEPTLGKTHDAVREGLIDEFIQIATDPANFAGAGNASPTSVLGETVRSWYERARGHLTDVEAFNLTQRLIPLSSLSDTTGLPIQQLPSGTTSPARTSVSKSQAERPCDGCCCNVGSWFTCPRFGLSGKVLGVDWNSCLPGCPDSNGMGCGFAFLWACNGSACQLD